VALLEGDHALAAGLVAEMSTNPVTTFVTLLLTEEKKQAADDKAPAAVIDNNQCKR